MKLIQRLAQHAIDSHTDQAATVLEMLEEDEVVRLLGRGSVRSGAAVLQRLSPDYATAVFERLPTERAARFVEALPVDVATRLVRRVDRAVQESVLASVSAKHAGSIRRVLGFREGTAGALMDPEVLALPSELSARDALQRVRKTPKLARYNVYVVDHAQRLVGALNLRELLLARGRAPLAEIMTRDPFRVRANADQASVLSHPGWRVVHALPVVDDDEAFVGVIRYAVLKALETEFARRRSDLDTGAALGEVIAAGARGILDAFTGPTERPAGGHPDGEA